MNLKKTSILLTIVSLAMSVGVRPVQAVTIPSFPSCSNPQGTTKVTYSEGTHGIVGDTSTHTGSDAVYTLSDSTLMQCFCATDGNGIQSNWWKVTSLSGSEIQVLKNEGWFYVPNGSLWGLSADPYMVKNNPYICRGGVGGGEILGEAASTGEVLGLAATGNITLLYGLVAVATMSLLLALALRRHAKK